MLAELINVQIVAGSYAIRYGTQGGYRFCILGALAFVARTHPVLGEVSLGGSTVREEGESDLFDVDVGTGFIRGVLTLVWDVEDVALIETAFEGDVSRPFGKHVPLRGGPVMTLWDFFHTGHHEDTLTTQADRNLFGQFGAARVLRQYVPDDRERYRRVLSNVLAHGGLYNSRGR